MDTKPFVPKSDEERFKKYADSLRRLYLSVGFIQKMFSSGGKPQGDAIIQIQNFKYQDKENLGARARVSDGLFVYSCVFFDEKLVDQLKNDPIPVGNQAEGKHPIIALKKYEFSSNLNLGSGVKTPIIVHEYEYITSCDKIDKAIPLPQSIQDIRDYDSLKITPVLVPLTLDEGIPPLPPTNKRPPAPPPPVRNNAMSGNIPISSITPYITKFRILGLCTNKEEIRTINSPARGPMKVLNFDLTDDRSDSIRVVAFGEMAEKLDCQIQVNCSYYLSNCSVRAANKRFNSTGHDYELTVRNAEDIVPCLDHQVNKPQFTIRRVPLSAIVQHKDSGLVDILAVIDNVGPIVEFTSRAGTALVKREVTLIDETATQVIMVLWAQHARDFDEEGEGHTIGIKGSLVKEFNGTYTITSGARFEMDPCIPGVTELCDWYLKNRRDLKPVALSLASGDRSSRNLERDFTFVDVAVASDLGKGEEKGKYFIIKGFFNAMKHDNCLYQACATENCQKKVICEQSSYRCEKCNKTMDNFKWNIILHAELIDTTNSIWVTLFPKACEQLLGMTAQQLGELRDSNQEAFEEVFQRAKFNPHLVLLRAKSEFYNEEERIKYTAFSVDPVDYDALTPIMEKTLIGAKKFNNPGKVDADMDNY